MISSKLDTAARELTDPPGGLLIWIIVWLELFTFGLGMAAFIVQQRAAPEIFETSRALLNQNLALANTLILITGGYFMVRSLRALREENNRASSYWILAAIASGAGFLFLKSVEYYQKISHGIGLEHNSFFTFYWLLTGFHFLHVALGTVLLLALVRGIRKGVYNGSNSLDVESCGVFWHMCDLIWLMLFPTFYLLS